MTIHGQFFAGVPLHSGDVVEVRNPAHVDEVVGTFPRLRPGDIDAIVRAADAAASAWTACPVGERFELIAQALAEVLGDGVDTLLTRENGKVLADSTREVQYLGYPVAFLAPHLDWLAGFEDLGDNGRHRTKIFRQPFGVVGIITPWNAPVGQSVITLAPALLAGNSVVAMVPATCPLAVLRIFGQLAQALPPGVLSLVASPDPDVAKALVEHPLVRNVHFTGSTGVGSLVAHEAADTIKPITLELGGNDAAIVLDDAFGDETIYARIIAAAFGFCGQACVALKRLYVPLSQVERALAGLGAVLETSVVGDGLDPGTTMGPLHTARGRERVERLVAQARAAGGTVHEFGTLAGDPEKGHFVLPTLVTGLDNSASLVQEEQFGPALPLIAYDTVDEAVAMANDSEFGLGGSVWSGDVERAERLALCLSTGMVWVNAHSGAGIDGRAPWGGFRKSSVGRSGANRAGLESFTQPLAVTVPTPAG
jgi:acyl-CoA reductase-like NAD-dependent aldehyde dehydrogenase